MKNTVLFLSYFKELHHDLITFIHIISHLSLFSFFFLNMEERTINECILNILFTPFGKRLKVRFSENAKEVFLFENPRDTSLKMM